jgi:AsmA protein
LRLSAKAANAGRLPLTEMAAAIRIKDGNADFDLGDAAFAGGRLQGDLKVSEAAGLPNGNIRLRFIDLDSAQMIGNSGAPIIGAPLSGMLTAEGKYAAFLPFIFGARGEMEMRSAKGSLRNFALADFRQRLDTGALFNLPLTYRGTETMNAASLKARIENGVAIVSDGRLSLGGGDLFFTGALPLLSEGIAVSGQLTDAEGGAVRRFFIGGSAGLPFVTPFK